MNGQHLPKVKPGALRCPKVPRVGEAPGTAGSPGHGRKVAKAGGDGGSPWLAHDGTRDHWRDNMKRVVAGEEIDHTGFIANNDPSDCAHFDRDPVKPRYVPNLNQRGEVCGRCYHRPRRTYPPQLLNSRGYLAGESDADETFERMRRLAADGLMRGTLSLAQHRNAAMDRVGGRVSFRGVVQPRVTSDMTPEELALEREASSVLWRAELAKRRAERGGRGNRQ